MDHFLRVMDRMALTHLGYMVMEPLKRFVHNSSYVDCMCIDYTVSKFLGKLDLWLIGQYKVM